MLPSIGSFTKFIGWWVGSCMIGGPPKNLTKFAGFLKGKQLNNCSLNGVMELLSNSIWNVTLEAAVW